MPQSLTEGFSEKLRVDRAPVDDAGTSRNPDDHRLDNSVLVQD